MGNCRSLSYPKGEQHDMNKKIRTKRIFSLNFICFLRCKGVKEKSVGFDYNTRKVYFAYEDNDMLEKLFENYNDSDVEIKLHDFISKFKQLKDEIRQYSKEFMQKRKRKVE